MISETIKQKKELSQIMDTDQEIYPATKEDLDRLKKALKQIEEKLFKKNCEDITSI